MKKRPAWGTGDENGASIHSAVNEYLVIDRNGNYIWITCGVEVDVMCVVFCRSLYPGTLTEVHNILRARRSYPTYTVHIR